MKSDYSYEAISEMLEVDDSGVLRWKKNMGTRVKKGAVAGTTNKDGYIVVTIRGAKYFAHRLAWLLYTGSWPSSILDHINGETSDNRRGNLRVVDASQNSSNRAGVKGVTVHKGGKFQAQIKKKGKSHYLGLFDSEAEARAAYRKASKELHGPYGARS